MNQSEDITFKQKENANWVNSMQDIAKDYERSEVFQFTSASKSVS